MRTTPITASSLRPNPRERGYTLVEAVIALTILVVALLPCIPGIVHIIHSSRYGDAVTAVSLLEQEARAAQTFPKEIAPVKLRTINGREWRIVTEMRGTPLATCKITAMRGGRAFGSLVFLVNVR